MYYLLMTIQYLCLVILMLEFAYIFYKWETKSQSYLLFIVITTLINDYGYLLEMNSTCKEEYLAALRVSYLGRSFIGLALFMFAINISRVKFNKHIILGITAFSFGTFFFVAHSDMIHLYYTSQEYVKGLYFYYLECGHGIWYILNSGLNIFYIVCGITFVIVAIKKTPNALYKKQLKVVCAAFVAESLFYLIQLADVIPSYDVTQLGYAIGTVIICYAIFKLKLLDTKQHVREYAIDELTEGIIAVDPNGNLEYYNKPAKKIFPVLEAFADKILKDINKSIDSGEPLEIEGRIYAPEKIPLLHDDVESGYLYAIVDDTEHYQYMKSLKEQKEIAEAANASKSAFLSVVSHEIRTPMNAVVGMTELLLRDEDSLNDKQTKYLKNIKNSGSALVMIVNDILDQSKIEAGKMEIIEDTYELVPMIEDVKLIIENRIGSKPIDMECIVDDGVPRFLVGDSLRIRQILINLLNNAVKFTESGFVRLKIDSVEEKSDKRLVKFEISDSGQGIKPEDLSRIGEAFLQVDTKKNHTKEGTGLGLSISRDFISLMGGQLEVSSEYGKGTKFFFSIWQGVGSDTDSVSETGVHKQAWNKNVNFEAPSARVLVVDDTKVNLLIFEELVEPIHMKVDKAPSGEIALDIAGKKRHDVIFMDYMMPGMNGVETSHQIRNLAKVAREAGDEELAAYYESVPIVSLTGDTSADTLERFNEAGIVDSIEKPVSLESIKKVLLKWLPADKIIEK